MESFFWRASSLGRIALCPGSLHLQELCGPAPVGEDAVTGTRCHVATSEILAGRPELAKQVRAITPEEVHLAHAAAYAFRGAVRERLGDCDPLVDLELELELRSPDQQVILTGTADAVARHGVQALIVDFKFGRRELGQLASWQADAYAAMVAQRFHLAQIFVVFFSVRDGTAYTRDYDFTSGEELERIVAEIQGIRDAAESGMLLVPGEEQCRYCAALGQCPAARRTALTTTERLALIDLSSMPSPKLGQAYAMRSVFEEVFSKLGEEIRKRAEAGDEGTGYQVVRCEGHREVVDPALAYERSKLGKSFLSCVTVSVPKLEAAWTQRYGGNDEQRPAEKKARFVAAMGDALGKKSAYTKLVRRGS